MLSFNIFSHNPQKRPVASYKDNATYKKYKENFKPNDDFNSLITKVNAKHYFEKRLYTKDEINKIVQNLDEQEKFVGSLPKKWLKNVKKEDIRQKTLEVGQIFSNFAKTMYTRLECDKSDYKKASKALADLLQEALNQPFKVKYYNSGRVGKVFLIRSIDETFALKIYHSNPRHDLTQKHGVNIEIVNAIYLNHAMKKNQCTKFYFGKLGDENKGDCFVLTKFKSDKANDVNRVCDNPYEPKKILLEDYSKSNVINNTIVDFGGISYFFQTYSQKEIGKILLPLLYKKDLNSIKQLGEKCGFNDEFIQILNVYMLYCIEDDSFKNELRKIKYDCSA